jgi:hypothetical protein
MQTASAGLLSSFPLVRKQAPATTLTIIGKNPRKILISWALNRI